MAPPSLPPPPHIYTYYTKHTPVTVNTVIQSKQFNSQIKNAPRLSTLMCGSTIHTDRNNEHNAVHVYNIYIYIIYNHNYPHSTRLMLDKSTLLSCHTQFVVTPPTPDILRLSIQHALGLVVMTTVETHHIQWTVHQHQVNNRAAAGRTAVNWVENTMI